jgi:hypothetical protein
MPSDLKGGRGRSAIYNWRVKIKGHQKGEVFSDPTKFACVTWMKEHKKEFKQKLRLIKPNM